MLPDWLARVLRPVAQPIPWARALRAALSVGMPALVGTLAGNTAYGLLISIGALTTVTADRGGAFRIRAVRVVAAGVAGATGTLIGSLTRLHVPVGQPGWGAVAVVTAVAVVSGVLSPQGPAFSLAALNLLLLTVVATGVAFPPPWWLGALLVGTGGIWTLLVAGLAAVGRRGQPESAAVGAAYAAAAAYLAGLGGESDSLQPARQQLTAALIAASDTVHTLRRRPPVAGGRAGDAATALAGLMAVVESADACAAQRLPVPPSVVQAVRRWGAGLRQGRPVHVAVPRLPEDTAAWRALQSALEQVAANTVSGMSWSPATPTRPRCWRAPAAWSGATRLAVCVGAAEALAEVVPFPHPYWIPLTVTLVLKPDFGSVFARALQRGLGTLAGVVVGAALAYLVAHGLPLWVALAALAALLPVTLERNYGMFATVITPIVILLLDALGAPERLVIIGRLLDTLLGAAIVLLIGYLAWPGARRVAVTGDVATIVAELAQYAEAIGGGDPAAASLLRRRIHRRLVDVRVVVGRSLAEPGQPGIQAAAWLAVAASLERVASALTAVAVPARHGGPPPDGAAAAQLAERLRRLTGGGSPTGDDPIGDAFAPVAAEVARTRTALAGALSGAAAGA